MKALILFGSPRKHGHTATLLDAFLETWSGDVERIDAFRTPVRSCVDCRACWKTETPRCAIDDEMQRIYRLIDEADRFVIATPVNFYGFPAPLKAIVDRCQCYWAHMRFQKGSAIREGRKAGAILVGGAPPYEKQFDGILGGLGHWLYDQRATLVGTVKMGGSDKLAAADNQEALAASRDLANKLL